MLREGPLLELEALIYGACEVMSRCELLSRIVIIVRVRGETSSEESVLYERLSKARIEKFVETLAMENRRVIKTKVVYRYDN